MPVLDSTFIIDFLRGQSDAIRLMEILRQGSAPLGVTPITTFELFHGVGLASRRDREEQKVEQLLDNLLVFPIEPEGARMAGLILAGMQRAGEPISTLDLLIGCTAVHHGQAVVTRNRRDFDRVPGIEVLAY